MEPVSHLGGALGRNIARALRLEDDPDDGGSGFGSHNRVFAAGYSADFDHHDRKSFNAAAGSGDFMRCSPTRNAWKPAVRSVCTSSPEAIPLSATLTMPAGIFSTKRSRGASPTS